MNQMTKKNRLIELLLFYWLPTIVWGLIIFSFSSIQTHPVSAIHWQDFIVKKTAHLTEYAIFAVLLFRSYKKSGADSLKAFYLAAITCLIYGATDEYHQGFTPGREPTLRDVLIDTWGSMIVLFMIRDLLPKFRGNLKQLINLFEINYDKN